MFRCASEMREPIVSRLSGFQRRCLMRILKICWQQSVTNVEVAKCTIKGPFKCYVTLFSMEFDPHPPPRNANNVEPYTFVINACFRESSHPPTAYGVT